MMDNLVPSLEVCKQLKEAGFPQETYFTFAGVKEPQPVATHFQYPPKGLATCAAPTAQEIADQLPQRIQLRRIGQNGNIWISSRIGGDGGAAKSMAEALAILYIKLQEVK